MTERGREIKEKMEGKGEREMEGVKEMGVGKTERWRERDGRARERGWEHTERNKIWIKVGEMERSRMKRGRECGRRGCGRRG